MSVRVRDLFMRELAELRYEPIEKRIRAMLGGRTVVDNSGISPSWTPASRSPFTPRPGSL